VDLTEFWTVVEAARAEVGGVLGEDGGEEMAESLVRRLVTLQPSEIVDFAAHFDRLHDQAYRWDVWAAAYLIMGGCSDDGFIDFRAGLIALGRQTFESTLADPDSLAGQSVVRAIAAEDLSEDVLSMEEVNYAGGEAYEQVTGVEDGIDEQLQAREGDREPAGGDPAGEEWDFDDDAEMSRRLPRLAALFFEEADD